jgi:flagellar secretion chaperone FliS
MAANPYFETSIRTASPVQLIVQLYDGALRFVRQAQQHHAADRPIDRGRSIARALAIVHELESSLDFEQGAEVARNLGSLYRFTADQLFEANRAQRVECLDTVIATLEPLRDAWVAIAAGDVPMNDQ